MVFTCDFDANPKGVVSGKSVRFFPRVSGNTSPITNYHWDFGDGSSHVDEPSPIHTYPTVTGYTTYDVTLTVTDSDSNTTEKINTDFITSDIEANITVPLFSTDIRIYIYDDTNSMMVKRRSYDKCSLYLIAPKTIDQLDKIGTTSFSILDVGNSTDEELSLIAEGKNIAVATNNSIVFSGVIRRVTQDIQGAFSQTTRVKKWNIECDSDLARHKKYPVMSTVLKPNGVPYTDSPGYIVWQILEPNLGKPEIRGIVDCIDPKIAYRLNSAEKEEVGSQYEHLMTIRDSTNYDLRSRPIGETHLGAEFVWGYLPVNGNFSIDWLYDYPMCGWGGYEYCAAPYNRALSTATVRVKPTRGMDGTNGCVFNITVQNDDGDSYGNFFYMYAEIETGEMPPAGATGVSFDFKISKVSHAPTITDSWQDWDGQKMLDFYISQNYTALYHLAATPEQFVPGDWIHVDITSGLNTSKYLNFALEANWDDDLAIPLEKYEFEVVIDNVRYTGYTPEITWAAMRLFDSPMWEYWDYSSSSGCAIPGTDILYQIIDEDFSGIFPRTLYKSLDGGVTWSLVTASLPNDVFCYPKLYGLRDGSLLAVSWADFGYGNHQNLLRSTDGGVTWVTQCDMPFISDSICEDYDGTLYSANGKRKTAPGAFYKSTDKGVTWQLVCAVPGWLWADGRSFICLANGDILGIGEQMNATYENYNGTIWRSTNKGVSWTYVTTFGTGIHWNATNIVQDEDGKIFVYCGEVLRISADNGNTWTTGTVGSSGIGSTLAVLADGSTLANWGGYSPRQGNAIWQSDDHGASWQLINSPYETNELKGNTIYFDNGVSGVVTDNDHYWAVCHSISGIEDVPPSGVTVSPSGYVIDFAPDLSQPHVVKNLDVNSTCFEFTDNDDKSKLSTQIVVRGKDYSGKSISVQVAGVHVLDNDRKFFNDATYVNQLSEGYIYKNSYASDKSVECTMVPGSSVNYTVNIPSGDNTKITVGSGGFSVGNLVSFTNPPPPLVHNQAYYIVDHTDSYIKVSSTLGGSPISLLWGTFTIQDSWGVSSCGVSGNLDIYIDGVLAKTVPVVMDDSANQVVHKIEAAFAGGWDDANGNTWTCTADDNYLITFYANYTGSYTTAINIDPNDTYVTPEFYSLTNTAWVGVTLEASDLSQVQVNNLDGWFTANMQIEFGATTMPTGLSAGTTYNVNGTPEISATAVFSLKHEGNIVNFTTAGEDVVCFKPNTIKNADENGNPCVWLYNWGYAIKEGDDLAISIPGESATALTAVGTPIEIVDLNGTMCTTVQVSSFSTQDYGGGKGFLLNKKLYVENASFVGNNEVLIGEELATISSNGVDTVYGPYIVLSTVTGRVSGATNKCYPHGLGALVARRNYSITSPEPGSGVALYGITVLDETVDQNITYGDLDAYATVMLLGFGNFWKKAACWVPMQNAYVKRVCQYPDTVSVASPIMVGDRISVTEYSGATPEEWQVVGVETIYDEGRMKLELGDFEKNVFTSLERKTNALNRTMT